MRTIFIGGIPGAGKTHLSRRLSHNLGIRCFSAGQLLADRFAGQNAIGSSSATFEDRQRHVIDRLRILVGPQERCILDGHFVLPIEGGSLVSVPESYFELLEPVALLLLDTPVAEVRRRLAHRDGVTPSHKFLSLLRTEEAAKAREVSRHLLVPLRILRDTDVLGEAVGFVSDLL